jgi:hypothetical protein
VGHISASPTTSTRPIILVHRIHQSRQFDSSLRLCMCLFSRLRFILTTNIHTRLQPCVLSPYGRWKRDHDLYNPRKLSILPSATISSTRAIETPISPFESISSAAQDRRYSESLSPMDNKAQLAAKDFTSFLREAALSRCTAVKAQTDKLQYVVHMRKRDRGQR